MKRFEAVNLAYSKVLRRADAEWLVALSLNIKRSEVNSSKELSPLEFKTFKKNLRKLEKNIPIQYIFGSVDFFGYEFKVNKSVLIPRPETEQLVDFALKKISSGKSVLDIGTGSGAIAVVIALKTGAKVTAVDISGRALKVARENARRLHADIEFVRSNLASALKKRKFDYIISNPPYVSPEEFKGLDRWVKKEPKLALVAKDNGLKIYRRIAAELDNMLNRGGGLFLEIGSAQAEAVKELFYKSFETLEVIKDLEGNDRIIYGGGYKPCLKD